MSSDHRKTVCAIAAGEPVVGGCEKGNDRSGQKRWMPGGPFICSRFWHSGNLGTLLNNWNKLDCRFCNPLVMKVLEWIAGQGIYVRSPSNLFQHWV